MSQFKNEGVYTGEIIGKEQKAKDGRVWGYMWTVAQMGQAIEFNVGEANFNNADVGEDVGIRFVLKQSGFKMYANVTSVQTLKQQTTKQSA